MATLASPPLRRSCRICPCSSRGLTISVDDIHNAVSAASFLDVFTHTQRCERRSLKVGNRLETPARAARRPRQDVRGKAPISRLSSITRLIGRGARLAASVWPTAAAKLALLVTAQRSAMALLPMARAAG